MQSEIDYNRINKVIETTLKNITNLIDVNTVVGSPIKSNDGELIIPVSKVTVGLLVGGGEYGKISIFKSDSNLPYSAGNGAIVSVKPCGFLIKDKDNFKLLSVSTTPYEKILDKVSDFIYDLKEKENNENI